MSLASYSDVKRSIAKWMHRANLDDTSPDFVTLAEETIYNGLEDPVLAMPILPLRIRAMEFELVSHFVAPAFALPDDYLESRELKVSDALGEHTIPYVPPERIGDFLRSGAPSLRVYTASGGALRFVPGPHVFTVHSGQFPFLLNWAEDTNYMTSDETVRLVYYRRFPALSDTAPTNWILQHAPQVYLCGAMVLAMMFTKDWDAMRQWANRYTGAIKALQRADKQERYSGATLSMRSRQMGARGSVRL